MCCKSNINMFTFQTFSQLFLQKVQFSCKFSCFFTKIWYFTPILRQKGVRHHDAPLSFLTLKTNLKKVTTTPKTHAITKSTLIRFISGSFTSTVFVTLVVSWTTRTTSRTASRHRSRYSVRQRVSLMVSPCIMTATLSRTITESVRQSVSLNVSCLSMTMRCTSRLVAHPVRNNARHIII